MPGTPRTEDKSSQTVVRIWELLEPVIRAEGEELIEVEYRREPQGWVLRLFIDRGDGVTVEDCARISQVVGDLLDVADVIHNPYHLEVSSPGLNRPLRKWEHFQKVVGKAVTVKTLTPIDSQRNFKGILLEAGPEEIALDCSGQIKKIPLVLLEKARLRYFGSVGE